MNVRRARAEDGEFVVEMARLACTLEDRPLPAADAPAVLALLPAETDVALVAAATFTCATPPSSCTCEPASSSRGLVAGRSASR